ncbi:MAG: polysaccharide biosynthesis/export family protein [Pseudomonadota bacterium]
MNTCFRRLAIAFLCCGLAACSLPRGAAVQSEVLDASDDAAAGFAVYPVTRAFLPSVAKWPAIGEAGLGWITHSHGSRGQQLAVGDIVNVTVWDSSDSSLLTGPGQQQVELPNIRIGANGAIFMPYVGSVRIAGLNAERARARLQQEIDRVAPSAQVQLSVEEGRGNSVDLVGGVQSPGSYPMPDRNLSVLALISMGGGVSPSLENPQIRLQRGHQIFGTSIDRLYAEPSLDTRLQPGDKIIVEEDDRYFLSVGATGREALHPFTKDIITAMDAVAITGGVNDARADPAAILILREYPQSALRAGTFGPREQRVVFTMDLTNADGLFSARQFQIRSGDVVYASESPINNVQTVFRLVGSAFGLVNTAANASN